MAAASIILDSNVSIKIGSDGNVRTPIQGSVSLSKADSNVTIARYEGGAFAGAKVSDGDYNFNWQEFGKKSDVSNSNATVEITCNSESLSLNGALTVSIGWNTDYGWITEYALTGRVAT